jgi:hypothetical protein
MVAAPTWSTIRSAAILFTASLRSMAFEGRILVIGFAGGTVPQIPANHLLVKNVDVIGLNWPAYTELHPQVMTESFRTLMHWYLDGAIKPHISATYPLEQAVEALNQVVTRKSTGKVVIMMNLAMAGGADQASDGAECCRLSEELPVATMLCFLTNVIVVLARDQAHGRTGGIKSDGRWQVASAVFTGRGQTRADNHAERTVMNPQNGYDIEDLSVGMSAETRQDHHRCRPRALRRGVDGRQCGAHGRGFGRKNHHVRRPHRARHVVRQPDLGGAGQSPARARHDLHEPVACASARRCVRATRSAPG